MKNKNGFTLIELLAVIAILALLVIIALPNVIKIFNSAKQDSFLTEAKEIFSSGVKQFTVESMKNNDISHIYYNDDTALDLTGKKIMYCMDLDNKGNVTTFKMSDGKYYIESANGLSDINKQNIIETNYVLDCSDMTLGNVTSGDVNDPKNKCVTTKFANQSLPKTIIASNCPEKDSVKSEYVSTESGINFSSIASDNNGKGLYLLSSTANDTYPIYFYRGNIDNNFVTLNNMCFQIVRTTSTGGTKIIYSGPLDSNGHCTASNKEKLTLTSQAIKFWSVPKSLANAGYMYGISYETKDTAINSDNYQTNLIFGNDVTYNNGNYVLNNTTETTIADWSTNRKNIANGYHYTCFNNTTTCSTVYYVHRIMTNSNTVYYITLTNGKKIEGALSEMLDGPTSTNKNSSDIKTRLEIWYKNNLLSYANYFEDTVFCNETKAYQKNGWDKDGDATKDFYFQNDKASPKLSCDKKYSYTTTSALGNGLLTYPIGVLTADEMIYAGTARWKGNSNYYLNTTGDTSSHWWSMTPYWFDSVNGVGFYMNITRSSTSYGTLDTNPDFYGMGARAVLSLNKNVKVTSGDGKANNPYQISIN